MKSYIADDLDCETDRTHFVTEIIWGGNAFVTFQLETNERNNNIDINAEASARLSLTELSGVFKNNRNNRNTGYKSLHFWWDWS